MIISPAPQQRVEFADQNRRGHSTAVLSPDGLGPLCTPAAQRSRRATFESPNLTACHFGPSLNQPRMACFL